MTASAFLEGLKLRLAPKRADQSSGYGAFTHAFDEVIDASDIPRVLPRLSPNEEHGFQEAIRTFELGFQAEKMVLAQEAARLVRDLHGVLGPEFKSGTIITFLVDHSGSMKGLRVLSALLALETAVDALAQTGIATEVLGFTTTTWKGGLSRRAWYWAGRPKNPGRLCDLRHIVYADVDSETRFPWRLRFMLRTDLLRENIDGEALEWAAGRTDTGGWRQRILLVVSDGAPVDDSTLLANDDRQILAKHLEATERRLHARGMKVGFLLIGNEHVRQPEIYERGVDPQTCGVALLSLLRRCLLN